MPIAAFQDKLGWSTKKACDALSVAVQQSYLHLLFSTQSAITFVDIIDYFANNIGIVRGGLLSIIFGVVVPSSIDETITRACESILIFNWVRLEFLIYRDYPTFIYWLHLY